MKNIFFIRFFIFMIYFDLLQASQSVVKTLFERRKEERERGIIPVSYATSLSQDVQVIKKQKLDTSLVRPKLEGFNNKAKTFLFLDSDIQAAQEIVDTTTAQGQTIQTSKLQVIIQSRICTEDVANEKN
jgi:hypothetical protein